MSGEQLSTKELNKDSLTNPYSKKVDINHLLYKVRLEKNKEKKENYMLVGLVVAALAVTGIISSF